MSPTRRATGVGGDAGASEHRSARQRPVTTLGSLIGFHFALLVGEEPQQHGGTELDERKHRGGSLPATKNRHQRRNLFESINNLLEFHSFRVPYQPPLCTTNLRKFTDRW